MACWGNLNLFCLSGPESVIGEVTRGGTGVLEGLGDKAVISQASKFELCPEGSGELSKDSNERDMILFAFLKDHSGCIVGKRLECCLDQRELGCGDRLGWNDDTPNGSESGKNNNR